jgi:hypothetical protein
MIELPDHTCAGHIWGHLGRFHSRQNAPAGRQATRQSADRQQPGKGRHETVPAGSGVTYVWLCHKMSSLDFAVLGLLASAAERVRFARSRLAHVGHNGRRRREGTCPTPASPTLLAPTCMS